MEEELKRETLDTSMQNAAIYSVYKTSNGLYAPEIVCREYNVGNELDQKEIKGYNYFLVTEQEIEIINQESATKMTKLIPNIMTLFDLQLILSFNVYVDIKHDNKYYIADSLCIKYNVTPLSKRIINGTTFCQVTEEDLTKIEMDSTNDKVKLKRNCIEMELEDEMKPAEKLFRLYTDPETQNHYVEREILELFRKNEIEIEGSPKIINDRNCYSITENQLKDVECVLHYRGVEQLLRPKIIDMPTPKSYPTDDQLKELTDQIIHFSAREDLFRQVREYDDTKVNDNIQPYLDRIAPPINDKEIIDTFTQTIEEKPMIIYRNKRSGKMYIPTDSEEASITIMHKPCCEIDFNGIRELDKKAIIASVYIVEPEEYNIIICNNNGQLFIAHSVLSQLGFYLENPYRIIVNKEIYEEISQEDIELIKNLESENCHINIVVKQIAPKRG